MQWNQHVGVELGHTCLYEQDWWQAHEFAEMEVRLCAVVHSVWNLEI